MSAFRWCCILLAPVLVACNALLGTESGESKETASEPAGDDDDAAAEPEDESDPDSSTPPPRESSDGGECGLPPECLDPTDENVIEVPTEGALSTVLTKVKPGQTIQLRGTSVNQQVKLPPFVTLRGCEGAKLLESASIVFQGSEGTVENLDVYGEIFASQTGKYIVRGVHCSNAGSSSNACITAVSRDGVVGSTVDMTVEQSSFEGRYKGIESETKYDTLTHEVKLTVRNNVFRGTQLPISVYEGGLVGKITADISFNTFIDFGSAVSLYSLTNVPVLRANLFASGEAPIVTDSPYAVEYSAAFGITKSSSSQPVSGALLEVDPKLDAKTAIPGATSFVVDGVNTASASDPGADFRGCPRPRPGRTKQALADIGALER